MVPICPMLTKLDKDLAEVLKSSRMFSPEQIARLRTLWEYDESIKYNRNKELFHIKEGENYEAFLKRAAKEIRKFKQYLYRRDNSKRETIIRNFRQAKENLHEAFKAESPIYHHIITRRASAIVEEVGKVLDELMTLYPQYTRNELMNGVSINGNRVGGIDYLLDAARGKVLQKYMATKTAIYNAVQAVGVPTEIFDIENLEAADPDVLASFELYDLSYSINKCKSYENFINHWNTLSVYACKLLSAKERYKIRLNSKKKLEKITDSELSQEYEAQEYDPEEESRNGYQQAKDKIAPLATMTPEVFALCSNIPKRNINGEVLTDDLGYTETYSPEQVRKFLSAMLQGSQSASDILDILQLNAENSFMASDILAKIQNYGPAKMDDVVGKLYVHFSNNYENAAIFISKRNSANRVNANSTYNKLVKEWLSNLTNRFRDIMDIAFFRRTQDNNGTLSKAGIEELFDLYNTWIASGYRNVREGDSMKKNPLMRKLLRTKDDEGKVIPIAQKTQALCNFLQLLTGNNNIITPEEAPLFLNTAEGRSKLSKILTKIDEVMMGLRDNYLTGDNGIRTNHPEISDAIQRVNLADGKIGLKLADNFDELVQKANLGSKKGPNIFDFLNQKITNDESNIINKRMVDIINIAESFRPQARTDSYKYIDKHGKKATYYNNVSSSSLYSTFEEMKYFMGTLNMKGFINWLDFNFLSNPLLCKKNSDGSYTFYNDIVKNLYESVYTNTGEANQTRFEEACLKSDSFLNNFAAGKNLGYADKKFPDCTDIEHQEMILLDYLTTHRDSNEHQAKFSRIPMFILGDANCYKSMVGITYGTLSSANTTIEAGVDKLCRVFESELEKFRLIEDMRLYTGGLKISAFNDTYDKEEHTKNPKKGFRITELPFLNSTFENGKYALTEADIQTIFNWNTTATEAEKTRVRENVKTRCQQYLKDRADFYMKDFVDKGILIERVDKKSGAKSIVVNSKFDTAFKEALKKKKEDHLSYEDIRGVVTSLYINTKMNIIDQVTMLDGGTSFYKNVKDFQKRNKQLHASGKRLDLEAVFNGKHILGKDKSERCVYFKDPKHNIETYNPELFARVKKIAISKYKDIEDPEIRQKRINKFLEDFKKCTVTDGQAYRTLSSYRKLLIMSHQWTEELESNYNKIQEIRQQAEGRKITDEEYYELADLAVSFKPIKPFTYAFETIIANSKGEMIKVPVQHKYAEAVLIPELLPEGSKLRDMAEWADEEITDDEGNKRSRCDLMLSEECVKVGLSAPVDISRFIQIRDSNGKIKETKDNITTKDQLIAALNGAYIHNIPYKGYRIQTNTPDHMYESTLFGTQARKMWYNGIDRSGNRSYSNYVNGMTITLADGTTSTMESGEDLIKFYNQLICANIIESFRDVEKLFKGKDSKQKLSKILLEGVFANNRTTIDALENFTLTKDDKFLLPVFAPTVSKEVQGALLSMFKKAVNKQKIAGGSAIQVSPMGSVNYDDSGDLKFISDHNNPDNIVYGECEIPFDQIITSFNGKAFRLSFGDYCNKDGSLKVGHVIGKWEDLSKEEKDKYYLYQSYVNEKGEIYVPKIEEDFKGILDLVAKRIPTERNYSMLRLRVKRFIPMASGATIKVPAEGCVLAGFDFDIDKLYLMRKEFRARKLSEDEISELWEKFYAENPEIKEKLKSVQDTELNSLSDLGTKILGYILNTVTDDEDTAAKSELDQLTNRLYLLWDKAKLEGDYKSAFNSFLNKHIKDFLVRENRFEQYNEALKPQENSTTARNNMLFDLFCKRLEDPETMTSRFTPGGFFNASLAARGIRELQYTDHDYENTEKLISTVDSQEWEDNDPEPERDYSEMSTLVYYNKQNQIADKLIGIFANHNITHAFLNTFDKCELNTAIAIGSHAEEGLKDLIQRDDPELRQKSELMIAELLAASVDAVKDPVLNYLNINSYTANIAALLARLGYDMIDIGLFLNQPIIHEYIRRCNRDVKSSDVVLQGMLNEFVKKESRADLSNMSKYSSSLNSKALMDGFRAGTTSTAQQAIVLQVFTKLNSQASSLSDITTATKMSASNSVGSSIAFFEAQKMNIDVVNKAFNSKDSEITISKDGQNGILLRNDLDITSKGYFDDIMNSPTALEQCFYDSSKGIVKSMESIFPYSREQQGYYKVCMMVKEALFNGDISENIINYINQDYLTFMMEQQGKSMFNSETPVNNLEGSLEEDDYIKAKEYFTKHFVSDYINFRNAFTKTEWEHLCSYYPIFDYLKTSASSVLSSTNIRDRKVSRMEAHKRIYISGISQLEDWEKQRIMDSWADMFTEDVNIFSRPYTSRADQLNELCKKVLPNLGKYLIYYSHYVSGNTYTPSSFLYSSSAEVLRHIDTIPGQETYVDFLNGILDASDNADGIHNMADVQMPIFMKYFIQNHTDFYQLVRQVSDPTKKLGLKPLIYVDGKPTESFQVTLSSLQSTDESTTNTDGSKGNLTNLFLKILEAPDTKKETLGKIQFMPAVLIGDGNDRVLYIADMKRSGEGNLGYTCTSDEVITYTKVPILGITDQYSQYSPEVTNQGELGIETSETPVSVDDIIANMAAYARNFIADAMSEESHIKDIDTAVSIVSREVVDLISSSSKYAAIFNAFEAIDELDVQKANLRSLLTQMLTPEDSHDSEMKGFLETLELNIKGFEKETLEKYCEGNGFHLNEDGIFVPTCK